MVAGTESFTARLAATVAATGSLLCVGLDPDAAATAAEAERHCRAILDATLEHACAVKPNLAFFEQHGSAGYAVLERLRGVVPRDRLLILDAKRGDIANTAAAYARGLFDVLGADCVTVNPLLGGDAVEPFLAHSGRGVFVLSRTSNPGAADFLEQPLGGGDALYLRIVDRALEWDRGRAATGFVVGATAVAAVAAVRARAPTAPILLPGVGAQGGALEEAVHAALDGEGAGVLVAVSRGIAAAASGPSAAARELRDRIDAVRSAAA